MYNWIILLYTWNQHNIVSIILQLEKERTTQTDLTQVQQERS